MAAGGPNIEPTLEYVKWLKGEASARGCLNKWKFPTESGLIVQPPAMPAPAKAAAPVRKRPAYRPLPPNALPITSVWCGTYRPPPPLVYATRAPEQEARPPRARISEEMIHSRRINPMAGA